jgi:quinol monooxygenase YgiN
MPIGARGAPLCGDPDGARSLRRYALCCTSSGYSVLGSAVAARTHGERCHVRPPRRNDQRRAGQGRRICPRLQPRCELSRKDPGCLQFEIFQSVSNPDKFALIELWESQAALDNHAKLQASRPPLPEGLRGGPGEREDYEYNRTR